MTTIQEFIAANKITATSEYAYNNPNNEDWGHGSHHYRVTLRMGRKQMTTPFSMGSAHTEEPSAEDVLDCLASDASGIENARSFEDWAAEYGYDTDSRKAEKIFKACQRQTEKLQKFMGEKYSALLWETERE